ncbi:MAG: YbfB/YjiJ family MFS transporter [Gammaproteobacteria bacterium]|nr:YbfB/YjiJ family MFS transporter [Gammaproteobacteria bacterium]
MNSACALGVLLPLLHHHGLLLALSFLLFSGSFMVVVAATTNMARLARPPALWPRWIGYFTIVFEVGQSAGPLIGGIAADTWDTDAVLWISGSLLALAALCALGQPATRQKAITGTA